MMHLLLENGCKIISQINGFRRRELYHCPTRSPDLISSDFFLWRWAEEEVDRSNPKSIQELEFVMRDVFGNLPNKFLRNSNQHIEERPRKCIYRVLFVLFPKITSNCQVKKIGSHISDNLYNRSTRRHDKLSAKVGKSTFLVVKKPKFNCKKKKSKPCFKLMCIENRPCALGSSLVLQKICFPEMLPLGPICLYIKSIK